MRIAFLGLLYLLNTMAFAQWEVNWPSGSRPYDGDHSSIVHGQIYSDAPLVGSLTVELIAQTGGLGRSTSADPGGSFQFRGLAPGGYQLKLTGTTGATVHEETIVVTGGEQNLSIHLPARASAQSNEATVSIQQLRHKVPGAAQKEFNKGTSAYAKGDHSSALEHFRKATTIDPEFADAFNGMGSSFVSLGQLQPAVEQFQRAVDLVPDHPMAVANLSIVLCKMKHFHEAAEVARRALRLGPGLLMVRYVLGISLDTEGGNGAEALDNLERAAAEFPKAHLAAAKILEESGRREAAVRHLELYLTSSPVADIDRERAVLWLGQLRRQ